MELQLCSCIISLNNNPGWGSLQISIATTVCSPHGRDIDSFIIIGCKNHIMLRFVQSHEQIGVR